MNNVATMKNDLIAELQKTKTQALYLSSFDRHLSEYVPVQESLRLKASGFTGSVAEALVCETGEFYLFVDGRYHEQADQECYDFVQVVKVPFGQSLAQALLEKIKELNLSRLAVLSHRTSYEMVRSMREVLEVTPWSGKSMEEIFALEGFQKEVKVESLQYPAAESALARVQKKLAPGEAIFINALDSLAWVLEARGYDYPYSATFRGVGYLTNTEAHVFLPADITFEAKRPIEVHAEDELENFLKKRGEKSVQIAPSEVNFEQYLLLERCLGAGAIKLGESLVRKVAAIKTPCEVAWFEESYLLASKAIYESIKWLKAEVKTREVSELEFNQQVTNFYLAHGMKGHSFKTISGFGPHGSIIHYSTPDADTFAAAGDLALLDSGAFFKGGYATDCTRTFLVKGDASAKQRELYTRVLKGFIKAMSAHFPVGTWGSQIDALARMDLRASGLDFAHGTGHGIGVSVHEPGYRISPTSQIPLQVGVIGSIEPGVYLPGEGGIRLENVVLVEEHPTYKGFLRFKNLIWVPFEDDLIMRDLLTNEESEWLKTYQAECLARL